MYYAWAGLSGGKTWEDKLHVCYCLCAIQQVMWYMCMLLAHNSGVSHKTSWATQIHEETWQKLIRPLPNVDGCVCYTVLGVYNDALFNILTMTLTFTFTVSRKKSGKYKQQLVSIRTVLATVTVVWDLVIPTSGSLYQSDIRHFFGYLHWLQASRSYDQKTCSFIPYIVTIIPGILLIKFFVAHWWPCHEAIHTLSKQSG